MNKETFAAELVCLLDVASLASDAALLKAKIESFFIAGSARIDLIAKVMDLDNDIGGDNFDIQVLQDTEKAMNDISKSPGTTVFFFRLSKLITRDALKGHTVSKNGSISFFFFVVATNRYINLFIKLSPLLLGMYCSDCLQQKQANQNPFLSRISRERGPTHPLLV